MVYKVPVATWRAGSPFLVAMGIALIAHLMPPAVASVVQEPASRVPRETQNPARSLLAPIASENWEQAARIAIELADSPAQDAGNCRWSTDDTGSIETWLPAEECTLRQIETLLLQHNELLTEWRRQADRVASRQLDAALRDASLSDLKQLVRRYRFSSSGDRASLALGRRLAARGELRAAIACLERIHPTLPQFDQTRLADPPACLPDSQLSVPEIAGQLVVLHALVHPQNEHVTANLETFDRLFADAQGKLGDRQGVLRDILRELIQEALPQETQTAATPALDSSSLTSLWNINIGESDHAESRQTTSNTPSTPLPLLASGRVFWGDRHRICAADLATGKPLFDAGSEVGSALNQYALWQSVDVSGIQEQEVELPLQRLDLSEDGRQLFATFADRQSSYIVGVDVQQQGKLLPGFPLLPPAANWRFDSFPRMQDGKLFVMARRGIPGSWQVDSVLLCYELQLTERIQAPRLLWQTQLCTAELQREKETSESTDEAPGEPPTAGLTLDSDRLICSTNLGVIAAVDTRTGRVHWLVRYPRLDWFDSDPDVTRVPRHRTGEPPLVDGRSIFVMPADSPCVLNLERGSGKVYWATNLPAASQLIGADNEHLLTGGWQVVWLDRVSGRTRAAWPSSHFPVQPGMRLPSLRGNGRAIGFGQSALLPATGGLFQVTAAPLNQGDTRQRATAQELDLPGPQMDGGHVFVETDIMLLVTGQRIQALTIDR